MYSILIVDDAKDSLLLLDHDLTLAGYTVLSADSGATALQRIENEDVDMVLLDIYMPLMSGLEVLQVIKSSSKTENIPVIMLSASDHEDKIVAALELGAADYVTKPYIRNVLLARINTTFKLVEKTASLEQMAQKDFLTGINNRRNFYSLAKKAISIGQRHQESLIIAMCDIDFFKKVNDKHGHDFGDKVLLNVSEILANVFRDSDIIGRIGGEEFAMCLPQTTMDEALIACERLRVNIEHSKVVAADNDEISVTMSIGLTQLQHENTLGELLTQADQALYQSKDNGRNQVSVYDKCSAVENDPNNSPLITEQQAVDDSTTKDYPGINLSTGINNVLGDENLFEQILVMFYQDHAQDEKKLVHAVARDDISTAKHLAHTLKGVASSIGAMELFQKAKILDESINEQENERYNELISLLGEKLSQVISGIEKNLAEKVDCP
ncbi:MAG: hypothetical protein COB35_00085 [Gammaproteobacteria bacterium]|nr:MAG: hypothetical protein COB35_00085 [Gammaproteobacteria bacterium]